MRKENDVWIFGEAFSFFTVYISKVLCYAGPNLFFFFFELFCSGFVRPLQNYFYNISSSSFSRYSKCFFPFSSRGESTRNATADIRQDTIGSADVGLKENEDDDRGHGLFGFNVFNRVDRWAQSITYIDIHECDSFTMCIFCFPTSSVIPLHDHPGMTVLSKVLYGSLHVKAYDWVEPTRIEKNKGTKVRLAKLAVDKVLTAPCDTRILYPNSGGNLHCFTAITPCAVLDILAPPYSEDASRICTYYHDYPYSSFSTKHHSEMNDGKEEEYAWLAEIETPPDLYMRSGRYTGPAVQI